MSISSTFSLSKRLLLSFIWLFIRLLAKTLRIKNDENARLFLNKEMHKQNNAGTTFLLFWHNQLLLIFLILITYKKQFPPITVLVSANKNVDIFAALLEKCGYSIIRGSANNKSLQALKGIHNAIKKKHIIAYAADGPTGPIYQFKPGAVFLSYKYKVPINLLHIKPAHKITFKTWDRLILPLPFTKIQFDSCKVMPDEFAAEATDTSSVTDNETLGKEWLDQSVAILQERMDSISGDCITN